MLLVWKLDRLARNVYLMECIRRAVETCKATIEAVESDVEGNTAESVLIRQILSAIAEYERKIIALRTKFAMLHHQRAGRRMSGKPPYGYRFKGDRLEPVELEQQAIQQIERLQAEELETLEIVRTMNASEHKTRTGRSWG